MIKRITISTTALILSIYMLVFGCGINVIHYCCNACAEVGVSNPEYVSCEQVHETAQCHDHSGCCGHEHHADHDYMSFDELCIHLQTSQDHCSLQRLTIDKSSVVTPHFVLQSNMHWIAVVFDVPQFELSQVQQKVEIFPNAPPPMSGRALLSNHSVLII